MNRKSGTTISIMVLLVAVCFLAMLVYTIEGGGEVIPAISGNVGETQSSTVQTSGTTLSTTTTTALTAEATETTTTTRTTVPETQITMPPTGKVAYLTFDDGPSENTEAILTILERYGIKATFFVVSKKNYDSQYRMIASSGNTIALHCYSHTYSNIYKSESAYFADLEKIEQKVFDLTGVRSRIIRFPGGSSNTVHRKYCKGLMDKLKVSVTERGYIYHDWNVDSGDASGDNVAADKLLANIKKGCKDKDVVNILMHDTGKSKLTTVEALPSIIEYLLGEGYECLPITEATEPIVHK